MLQSNGGSVGQPGFGESLIPIWGSARAAVDDFQNGRWGWGIFNSVMAVSDVFLVKSLVTAVGKLAVRGSYTTIYRAVSKAEVDDIAKYGLRMKAGGYETGKLFAPTIEEAA